MPGLRFTKQINLINVRVPRWPNERPIRSDDSSDYREDSVTIRPEAASLIGKVAVVTGAAKGLGAAVAEAYGAFGASLALCDRDGPGLEATAGRIRDAGRQCRTEVLDVRDDEAMRGFLERSHAELGPIDVLVNNAGGTFRAWFAEVSPKGHNAVVDLNFTSVANTIRSALPHLRDGASIINVTSIEAHRAAPGFAIYAAMKAAVENLTRSLALELSDRRIRVNVLAPDAIPTPGDDALAEELQSYDIYGAKIALGIGTPDDFAGPAVFLASDLSRWVTGTTIHVDGGSKAGSGWGRTSDGGWVP
jgi:3-oxoacyl-[acyl-carrier protein] reductase